jgi:hypothetical protein
MKRSFVLLVALLLAAVFGAVPAAAGATVELLPNGTLSIEGTTGDDVIVVEATGGIVDVTVDAVPAGTFPAAAVAAISVSTGDGDDRVRVASHLPSWTLDGLAFDLGDGLRDGTTVSVYDYGVPTALSIAGNVRSVGGSLGLRAGSEAMEATLTVEGSVTASGSPGDDSFGLETEFPKGTVHVEGDVRFIAGSGDDYAEFLINGTVVVDGDFMVLCQAGDLDYVFLDGIGSGTVGGRAKLFGGSGDADELEIGANFTAGSLMVKQFEACSGCP